MLRRVAFSLPSFRILPLVSIRPFSCESVRDFMINENLLELPEEIAVFKGDNDLFEPCCSFVSDSIIRIPTNLSKEYVPEVAKATSQLCKMRNGVVQLRVSFVKGGERLDRFPTAFALSPTVLFTDYHCVPPQACIFNTSGDKTRLNLYSIHARTDNNPSEVAYEYPDTLSLDLITRVNSVSQHQPIYDPINGKEWTRGNGNADLAVLKISSQCDSLFDTFFFPCAYTESLSNPAYFGYSQPITPSQLEKVITVMNAQNYHFPDYMDVPPEQQQLARREAVASALQKTFCGYNSKILSLGSVLKKGQYIAAVTNPSTTGTSGSPYVELRNPLFVVGNHLGGGLQVSPNSRPNHNLLMTVDHPEWVVKYVKYVLPSLPAQHWPQVRPYIQKHERLLEKLDCVTPEVRQVLA